MRKTLALSFLLSLNSSVCSGFFFTSPPGGGTGGGGDWGRNFFAYLGGLGGGFYATPSDRYRWIDELNTEMYMETEAYLKMKNSKRKRGEREMTPEDCHLHNDDFLEFCAKRKEDRKVFDDVLKVAAIYENALQKEEKDLENKRRMYEDCLKANKIVIKQLGAKNSYKKMIKSVDEGRVKAKMVENKFLREKKEKLRESLKRAGYLAA